MGWGRGRRARAQRPRALTRPTIVNCCNVQPEGGTRSSAPDHRVHGRRRVANIYFTINAALSLTPYSPVRCVGSRCSGGGWHPGQYYHHMLRTSNCQLEWLVCHWERAAGAAAAKSVVGPVAAAN